jgi:uncharacterized membrane protein HdeD (DUF308 family)
MFKSAGNSLILRGLLALAVGVMALAWPGVTVLALVIMFAVYAFFAAVTQLTLAFGSARAKPVIGHLLVGLVDVTAGAVALAWPAATALVLVILVGSWAVMTGIIEFAAGLRSGEAAGTRAMLIVGSLLSVAFGVVLFARPDIGAITLALLFGWFNVIVGTWMLIGGAQLRSTGKKLHALAEPVKTRVAV